MKPTPPNAADSFSRNIGQDQQLDYLLRQMTAVVPADVICLFTRNRDSHRLEMSHTAVDTPIDKHQWEVLSQWLMGQVDLMTTTSQTTSTSFNEGRGGMHSILLWPFLGWGEVLGAVVLMSQSTRKYTEAHIEKLETLVQLAQTVVSNMNLTERLITTEAISFTAQAIARNPSPQNIVHALRDYLFDVHISSCIIGLFGPVREDRPNGPFDYIEIEGSWSRRLGSKVGVGVRFDLQNYHGFLTQLEEYHILTIHDPLNQLPDEADDFTRMMLRVDNIQSMTLMLLQSERSKLGIIAIMTDVPYEFAPHEVRAYQIVSDFLTMSTMAAALQKQADFVQQGRAALLDAVTDGVIMVLPDEDSSVLTVNNFFTKMFGLKEREVQGITLHNLLEKMQIPASIRRELYQKWRDDTASRMMGEFRMATLNGTQSDIQWYSAPVYQEGQVLGNIYTFHDITPERTAERLRSELLSRISHELRTPLTSIRGFAEFILEVSGDDLPPLAREYTEIIHKSAIHLNHLFSDMIEITRANAGGLKLTMRDADLNKSITDITARLRPQSTQHNQVITTNLTEQIPLVYMDTDRIEQVLTNLVNNAIKYAPENTEIRVSSEHITLPEGLSEFAPPDIVLPCALVSVVDAGKGLNAAEADKVFLPFYRTKDAKAGKIEGAGLGLAIAHSIIELHRGKIWAEPTNRKMGGQFFFTIPTREE